jgi:hypothetical protein
MRSEQPASAEQSTPHNEIASSAWTPTSAHANAVLDAALNGDVCTCGKKTIQAASHHRVDCPYRLLTEAAQMLTGCTPQAFGGASRTAPSADLAAIGQAIIDSKPPAGRHKLQFALARQVLAVVMQCRFALMLQRQAAAGNNADVGPIDREIEALGDIEQACHAEVIPGYLRSPARWMGHTSFPHMVSAHLNAWRTALEAERAAVATQDAPDYVLAVDRWLDAVSELRSLCATAIHELSDGAPQNAVEF